MIFTKLPKAISAEELLSTPLPPVKWIIPGLLPAGLALFAGPILKINALPADKKATFSTEEIRLMRTTVNQLRNERLAKGQYTDAADDMLLKLF